MHAKHRQPSQPAELRCIGAQAVVRCGVAVQLLAGGLFLLDPVAHLWTPLIIALAALTGAWRLPRGRLPNALLA